MSTILTVLCTIVLVCTIVITFALEIYIDIKKFRKLNREIEKAMSSRTKHAVRSSRKYQFKDMFHQMLENGKNLFKKGEK